MRSAYGLEIPAEDPELTHVGPGTPCGELMRRFWQPICLSEDLKDVPKRVRILGEDLVAFRDGNGRPGLLFFRCSHRGVSLEYGRIEPEGIRCCYHGWLYDVEGNCLEMPLEPADSTQKERIQQPGYPVQEFGGLLFAYMGPPDKVSEFPKYDVLVHDGGTLNAWIGPRVGGASECNWLQSQENIMDILHVYWLHMRHGEPQFPSEIYAAMPTRLDYEEIDLGMRAVMAYPLPDGREFEMTWEMLMPMAFVLWTDEPDLDGPESARPRCVYYCIPIDDTHQWQACIYWMPEGEHEIADAERIRLSALSREEADYEYAQRNPDDKEAQEGQGPIAIHGLENLATSDQGVVMFRKILKEQIQAVREDRDPKGIIRDPELASCVPTTAGMAIRAPQANRVA